MFKLTFSRLIADNKNGMKKALIALLSVIILTLWLISRPGTVLAQSAQPAAASDPCGVWFLSPLDCLKPALTKAIAGALNKQGADVGTASFSMGQFIISTMGMCDTQCDPSCPRGLSYQNSALAPSDTTVVMRCLISGTRQAIDATPSAPAILAQPSPCIHVYYRD